MCIFQVVQKIYQEIFLRSVVKFSANLLLGYLGKKHQTYKKKNLWVVPMNCIKQSSPVQIDWKRSATQGLLIVTSFQRTKCYYRPLEFNFFLTLHLQSYLFASIKVCYIFSCFFVCIFLQKRYHLFLSRNEISVFIFFCRNNLLFPSVLFSHSFLYKSVYFLELDGNVIRSSRQYLYSVIEFGIDFAVKKLKSSSLDFFCVEDKSFRNCSFWFCNCVLWLSTNTFVTLYNSSIFQKQ